MALEPDLADTYKKAVEVLILVLMEWRWNIINIKNQENYESLNPCSNGMALELIYDNGKEEAYLS